MLSDVLGHDTTKQYLIDIYKRGTIHHAIILYGPPRVGKFRLAKSLSRLVNCTAHGHAACTCASCIKITGGYHPDVKILEPNEHGRITMETVKDGLLAPFEYKVHEGKRKVGIIRRAHQLMSGAANALLKALEEPKGDTLFILTTSDFGGLLDTVRSRCHPVRLSFLSSYVLEELLKKDSQEPDPIMLELMGGIYDPRAIQDDMGIYSQLFAGRLVEYNDNLERDVLDNELRYLGGVFAYMQREKLHQFGKVLVPRANSQKLGKLFDATDKAMDYLVRGVKPYLVARWYEGRLREQIT